MENFEYRVLSKCASGLTDLLQHNLSISGKLLEKGLISRDVHDWVQTAQGVSNRGKADRLVSCLIDRVRNDSQVFHDFVDLLNGDPFFTNIVEKINKERLLLLCSEGTGDISEFQYLLSQPGVDTNIYDKDGLTPLWYAALQGRNDLLLLLLEHGAEVDLPADDKWGSAGTALTAACIGGNVITAALLIEKEAAINYINKAGHHPLFTATLHGRLESVKLLLDSSAIIDLPTNNRLGFTALMAAAQQGHSDIARLLIERGAVVDYINKYGATPLYMASQQGHDNAVQVLLRAGASVDLPTKNEDCRTALCIACQNGHAKVVMTLISNKADVNYQAKNGLTALMVATQGGHADIIEILLDANANPNIMRKTTGWSAIFIAAQQGNVRITELLMKGGAKLDIKDKNRMTAFEVAKSHDQQAICDLLEA